jgi:hypothetical protein
MTLYTGVVSRMFYMGVTMSAEEKNTWTYALLSFVAYVVYIAIVAARAQSVPVADVAYIWPLIWTFVATIIAMVVGRIVIRVVWRGEPMLPDERDRQIDRFGYRIGYMLGGLASGAALILALVEVDYFWIANTLYFGCFLTGFVGAVAKIVAYRRGYQR